MKAAVNRVYGPPEVVHIEERPSPNMGKDDILIAVKACSVNRSDVGFRAAEYFIIRFFAGLFKPKIQVLGTEFAGVVTEVGASVTSFKVGDRVFGLSTAKFGAHAQYLSIPASGSVTQIPADMSFAEAAAVCDGMMLAHNYLRCIDFSRPVQMLINGASGSIGSAALQMAAHLGAQITATGHTGTLELLRKLGAKEAIDYTKEDFTKLTMQFDVVLDAVGKSSFFKCRNILKPGGVYFSTELGYLGQNIYLPLLTAAIGKRRVKFPIPTDNKKDIEHFASLIENGFYTPVIDKIFPFDEIVAAYKYVETRMKVGNVVIKME
jgi:NADPH:quinone reductase-like Zn-dependent oxidoreductase